MNLKEAVDRACTEPTLVASLTWIAIWESERAIAEAFRNDKSGERNPDGSKWGTCFGLCFQGVIDQWHVRVERENASLRAERDAIKAEAVRLSGVVHHVCSADLQAAIDETTLDDVAQRLDRIIELLMERRNER